jgi:hypothetical protein
MLPDLRFDAGATMNVLVTDDTGLPVQHANVGVLQKRAGDELPRVVEAETAEKSQVTLSGLDLLLAGQLSCTATGFVRGSHHFDTLPATATCVVTRFAKLTAHVEDEDRREPRANAALSINGRELARSGSNGDLIVRSLAAGSYDVTIAAPGFAPHTEHVTVQPGANIAGAITVGEQTYVGMGAVIVDKKTIGAGCLIAAGAVVTSDMPDRVQVMGVPGKITKTEIAPK